MHADIEWTLLKLLCSGPFEGDRRAQVVHLIQSENIDYGRLMEQATAHRLLNLVGYAVQDDELAEAVPGQLRGELVGLVLANRRRVRVLTELANEVIEYLTEAGIPVAATKGVVLEPTVYQGLGLRKMLDIDLVIHPDSRAEVVRLMAALGLVNGVYDWRSDTVEELPARVRAKYRLSPDHLPHYRRLDTHGGGVLTVDFANSLTWAASEWQLDMGEVLSGTRRIKASNGMELSALSPAYLFLSVVLHLFRESWFMETITRGKDTLGKFADVARLWGSEAESLRGELPAIIARHQIAQPVGWTLVHTDRVLGTTMATELGLVDEMTQEWLASAQGPGGVPFRWEGTMQERLLTRDRASLFSALAPAG